VRYTISQSDLAKTWNCTLFGEASSDTRTGTALGSYVVPVCESSIVAHGTGRGASIPRDFLKRAPCSPPWPVQFPFERVSRYIRLLLTHKTSTAKDASLRFVFVSSGCAYQRP
jgi:hypothetical protein